MLLIYQLLGRRKQLRQTMLKRTLMALGLAAGTALAPISATAEDYPSGSMEVVHQFGPGGGTDRFIRAIGEPFKSISGASLVPISVSGGAGIPASVNFEQRPGDGSSLMAIGPEQVINHALGRIDLSKYQPVARIQYDQGLFYVAPDSEYQNIEDLIAHLKDNPGDLKLGVTGAAGFDAMLAGLWNTATGAELTLIPFEKSSEAMAAVLGGHIDVLYEEYGPVRGALESNELVPLVVFSEERLPVLPDVPTAEELGYDVTLGRWRGVAIASEAAPEKAEKLYSIFEEAVDADSYKKIEEQSGLQYRSELIGPKAFQEFLENEVQVYTEVLKSLGQI